jgi:hypothetical protein
MKKLLNKFILWLYTRRADYQYQITGKQHFVVPVTNYGKRKYTLMNNELHNAYNKKAKKLGKPKIKFNELLAMSVYKTGLGTLGKR